MSFKMNLNSQNGVIMRDEERENYEKIPAQLLIFQNLDLIFVLLLSISSSQIHEHIHTTHPTLSHLAATIGIIAIGWETKPARF